MIVPNPIRLAIASAAFGAGVTMIVFGALKGAYDIIKENETKQPVTEPTPERAYEEPEFVVNTVDEEPDDASDNNTV